MVLNTNENNASEYTTPESTTSAQNASQAEASTTNQFVRISTRVVNLSQNTHNPRSSSDISPNRYKIFSFPPSPEEEIIQDRTQNKTTTRDISVNVLSPTRTKNTKNKTRFTYDPPSVPPVFKHSIRTNHQIIFIITTNKLPVNFMIHLIIPIFHHLIQILNQIILKMFLNLITILLII